MVYVNFISLILKIFEKKCPISFEEVNLSVKIRQIVAKFFI
jgi:hypothetical protein